MSDYDDEDFHDVAADSSGDNEETIRRAYLDAKTALLSEEPNTVACFQRVLTMEDKKGSKTMWGFKALKHLVVANIQANDFEPPLINVAGWWSTATSSQAQSWSPRSSKSQSVLKPRRRLSCFAKRRTTFERYTNIASLVHIVVHGLQPTTTWMTRCITLLSDVRHTQRPEILAEALETTATLQNIIRDAPHLDAMTRHSRLLSIDAITAEIRFRRQEFEEVYSMYKQLKGQSPSANPGAVAAIYEIFAKVLLLHSSSLKLGQLHWNPLSLTDYCLGKALKLYPRTDTQAHIRCWRYLAVNQALRGKSTSSNMAMPEAFKPEGDAVVRLAALYTNDHGDLFLAALEQARTGLADPFLQEFFDACAEAVRTFRNDLQEWRHLFEAGSYRECYLSLRRLAGDPRRRTSDNMVTMEMYAAVRDTRTLIICAAEIETFHAEGRQYTNRASSMVRLAQTINSRAAAFVCQFFGQDEMRSGRLNAARKQLSRAFVLYADGDQDRRRECAVLLAFCNFFQVYRVKYRIEGDIVAFLGQEQCEKLKELADAFRRADAQGFAQLLKNSDLRLSKFMQDLLATRGPWFDAIRFRIGAFIATAPPESGRNVRSLRQIYEESRELDNCNDTEVMALSVMHDLWGHELLSCRRFASAGRHFEKALRAYESNISVTEFLGASFLAFTSLTNGVRELSFDEVVVRFDLWLSDEAKATLRRFYDAYKSEDIAVVEEVLTSLKESNDKLADVTEHYASVLHTKLQLRQFGTNTNLAWTLVFDRLSHRDLHVVQFACRSFRSIARTRLRHAPIGPIVVSAQQGAWRNEWALQGLALRPYWRATGRDPITTVELVERLEECGSSPIPKLLIRGDAPLDHPQLMEYVAKHEVVEHVLETDLSRQQKNVLLGSMKLYLFALLAKLMRTTLRLLDGDRLLLVANLDLRRRLKAVLVLLLIVRHRWR
ncbi:hypothetical protein AAVH_13183 [Aphelenchoides avenae]|nr:hypothetical protein AAVH_13183 [Aphelenchus avenae]